MTSVTSHSWKPHRCHCYSSVLFKATLVILKSLHYMAQLWKHLQDFQLNLMLYDTLESHAQGPVSIRIAAREHTESDNGLFRTTKVAWGSRKKGKHRTESFEWSLSGFLKKCDTVHSVFGKTLCSSYIDIFSSNGENYPMFVPTNIKNFNNHFQSWKMADFRRITIEEDIQ